MAAQRSIFLVAVLSAIPLTGLQAQTAPQASFASRTTPGSAEQLAQWLDVLQNHPSAQTRALAAQQLVPYGGMEEVTSALQQAMRDLQPQVRRAAAHALDRIAENAAIQQANARTTAPEPLMDLSFRPAPTTPNGMTLLDNEPKGVIEPAGFANLDARQSSQVSQIPDVSTVPSPTPSQAPILKAAEPKPAPAVARIPVAAPAIKTEVPKPKKVENQTAPEQTAKESFSLYRVPRTPEGRKAMGQRLLAEARQALNGGDISKAEEILYQLKELAIEFGGYEDNPTKLQADIARSRPYSDLLYPDLRGK